jgi:peptidoglycan/LPS O-acetylase OafA/YrhL
MPRLDGLRAVAIGGVLIHHLCPNLILRGLELGPAGVTLFFVLSGYLITRILMNYRGESIVNAAANFYWRRFLRLSPPFYLAILVAAAANVLMMRETWWIHALYLTNFQLAISGVWNVDAANHLWSLCTEEQFYLLWFFVVVALPKNYLLPAIWISILIALVFRSAFMVAGLPFMSFYFLPCNLAPLAIGALLALARSQDKAARKLGWFDDLALDRRCLIATGLGFCAISIFVFIAKAPPASLVLYPFIVSAFAVCLVARASINRNDALFDWLTWAPLRYIGKISYGIYVYHLFLRPLFAKIPGMAWVATHNWPSFFFLSAASILVAHLSWRFLESPILRLKKYAPTIGPSRDAIRATR